jgi:hypothetical protein
MKPRLLLLAAVAAAMLAAPASASADDYCVGSPSGCSGTNEGTDLQQALTDAVNHTGADRVLIGQGNYSRTGGFSYADGNTSNPVEIIGVGSPLPQLTMTSNAMFQAVLSVQNSASTVTNLSIDIPGTAVSATGLQAGGGVVSDHIVVTGSSSPTSLQTGIGVNGSSAVVKNCVIDLSPTFSSGMYIVVSGQTVIRDNSVTAGRAMDLAVANGSTVLIRRNRLSATNDGILMYYGDVDLDNTLIDLRGGNGVGIYMDTVNLAGELSNTVDASQLTIRNGGATSSAIVQSGGPSNADPNATQTINLTDSIIRDVGHPIEQQAPAAGATYTVNSDHDDYDATLDLPASPGGQIVRTETNMLNVDPLFLNPISGANGINGDYRLAYNSPVIDMGSSTPLAAGEADLAGQPRIVDGVAPFMGAVRDLGAYEFQPVPPTTTPAPTPASGPTGQQAAALKKCKRIKNKVKRKKCKKRAKRLPL